jgi:hypothetical protein
MMPMVARLRTNVLKREEKGIGPISFPRLLLAGLTAVFAVLGVGRGVGFGFGCVSGVLLMALVLFITQPVSGTPMGQFLAKVLRGGVVVNSLKAEQEERSSAALDMLANVMRVNTEEGILNCDEIFDVPEEEEEADHEFNDLVFFRDITDLDSKSLQVMDNPFNISEKISAN